MEERKSIAEELENQYGTETDNRGKTTADIINKAKQKTAEENEKRAVEEAQRNLAKTEYLKKKTLLENRMMRKKAENKNTYTKAICDASDKYTAGEIDADEQNKLIKEADEALYKANNEAENTFSVELRKLREAEPIGYRAAEW